MYTITLTLSEEEYEQIASDSFQMGIESVEDYIHEMIAWQGEIGLEDEDYPPEWMVLMFPGYCDD